MGSENSIAQQKSFSMPAIIVQDLSKHYKLYHSRFDRMKEFFHPFRKKFHQRHEVLKDISFQLERGEVLGIIGQNGSGKSTLLKILNSVVTATSGSFHCNGRVTALLELGGGFNQDLTGIENIYYLGAIQGITKKEMKAKVQQILDFAEIGEYAYQPVKTYSSGMYVRLAFSMAINIDPDILITDEALSVGDIRFQQKCYRKIREFKEAGKTILLCTHSLSAIKEFCTRAIWLHEGVVREEGDPDTVAEKYNTFMLSLARDSRADQSLHNVEDDVVEMDGFSAPVKFSDLIWQDLGLCDNYGTKEAKLKFAAIISRSNQRNTHQLSGGEPVRILLNIETKESLFQPGVQLTLNNQYGNSFLKIKNYHYQQPIHFKNGSNHIVAIDFDFPHVGNGRYTISFGLLSVADKSEQQIHWVHDGLIIEVSNAATIYKSGSQIVVREVSFSVLD
jgi:ABC-type polysaccharide/polyol phosphate transport system ATPase subunit